MLSASAMNWAVEPFPPAVRRRPRLEDVEEVLVPDGVAEDLEGHRAAAVDREVEQLDRPRVADRQLTRTTSSSSSGIE